MRKYEVFFEDQDGEIVKGVYYYPSKRSLTNAMRDRNILKVCDMTPSIEEITASVMGSDLSDEIIDFIIHSL